MSSPGSRSLLPKENKSDLKACLSSLSSIRRHTENPPVPRLAKEHVVHEKCSRQCDNELHFFTPVSRKYNPTSPNVASKGFVSTQDANVEQTFAISPSAGAVTILGMGFKIVSGP